MFYDHGSDPPFYPSTGHFALEEDGDFIAGLHSRILDNQGQARRRNTGMSDDTGSTPGRGGR